jgi:putative copper export protein
LLPFGLTLLSYRRTKSIASMTALTRRFSNSSLFSVAILAASGVVNGFCLLGTAHNLFSTTYGLVLLAKLAMFVIIVSMGAANLLRFKPALPQSAGKLQVCVTIEMLVATIILILAGLLGIVAPAQM